LYDPDHAELAQRVEADAAIRSRYESVQAADEAVQAAFHDVPVPQGLEQRLLAAVAERESGQPSNGVSVSAVDAALSETDADPQAAPKQSPPKPKRRWLRWAGVGSAAAIVLIAVAAWAIVAMQHTPPKTVDALVHRSLRWVEQTLSQPWEEQPREGVPDLLVPGYPLESSLRAVPRRRQQFRDDGDTIVAYDLAEPGQPVATQFTIQTSQEFDVPSMMLSRPLYSSGPFCVGACQRGGVLYVLVVEGDAARFRQFVRTQPIT
jgi:hypothetical protein